MNKQAVAVNGFLMVAFALFLTSANFAAKAQHMEPPHLPTAQSVAHYISDVGQDYTSAFNGAGQQ